MAAETRHAGLTADDRSTIRSTVLKTRETIENDLYRQLERYGVYDDERVDIDALGHLDAYDKQIRSQIDAALDRELEATDDDYERSVKNYVREATKTYLNRLVALKAIEVRGLVTETMIKRPEYGNRSEIHRTVDEVAGELTDQSDKGLGVAVELAFTELTDEIGVIFEESEHTAIDLDFTVREEIIEQLNAIDVSVWESDEAMGWVYQYFGEREREEIDDRISDENYKVRDTDVATKTQLFTPRYIVEWMVDNSLGRLWMEMQGEKTDINDEDSCFYLAPLQDSLVDQEAKKVRDIKILDPACGSGHMLFYAFDVLYEMYLEEGNIAEKYIPREILKNNLYGIDIDPGAAQLAALALYVKAKNEEKDVEIDQINITSADAVLVNGNKKEEVLAQADSELEKRVLEQVWKSFDHIREWGSLVRIEEQVEKIIEEEREEVESIQAQGQARFTGEGDLTTQSSFVSNDGEESWDQVKERLLSKVSKLADDALEQNDPIEEMFAGEVEKSVRLLDLFIEEYDVVISNPPYLGSGKMDDTLKQFVKDNYRGSRDLYTAFIERCTDLTTKNGYSTLVTPENFMFLYSFRGLRSELLHDVQFVEGIHLSGHSFDIGDRPFTIPFVLRNSEPADFEYSRFARMTHEQEKYSQHKDKKSGLIEITQANRSNQDHSDIYTVNQNSFLDIDRTPILYWFGDNILSMFSEYPQLGDLATVNEGIGSGDDDYFIRDWWEIPESWIGDQYKWIMMSGDDVEYYYSTTKTVRWEDNGEELIQHPSSNPRNLDEQRKAGLSYRNFGKHFTARVHPDGFLFSNKSPFINISENKHEVLGYLCSTLTRYIMNGMNPGINFNTGDGKRLPIKREFTRRDEIEELVKSAIELRTDLYAQSEIRKEFDGGEFITNTRELLLNEDLVRSDIRSIHGIIDEIINDEYNLDEATRSRIYHNLPKKTIDNPHVTNTVESENILSDVNHTIPTESLTESEYENLVSEIEERSGNDIVEISIELSVSPHTVAYVRNQRNQYTRDEQKEAAGRVLSYYLGVLFGRWENHEDVTSQQDGILVFDDQFNNDVTSRVRECIAATSQDPYDQESEIENLLNKDYTEWLRENFFRYHHTKEYRRRGQRIPIYWHLESDQGAFSCFLYYHSMDGNTLSKLRGQYIDTKIDTLQNRLEAIEGALDTADGDQGRELRTEKEDIEADLDDITEFRERVDALIDDGFEPDLEAGIWANIQEFDEHDLLAVPLDKL